MFSEVIIIKHIITVLWRPLPRLPRSQITVSSGGMLVQKLRTGNLQSDRGRFDGTMVYAQHKVGHKDNIHIDLK